MMAMRPPKLLAFASLIALLALSCDPDPDEADATYAEAFQSTHRTQLIGGPGALGEVGDWVIQNDKIRLVVQDTTFNRGTGLFGGSLIDADLVRQDGEGDPFGGNGRDTFGEAFPAFFLEVIDPEEIVIVDPSDMERDDIHPDAAVLEVRGYGGEFITLARLFNQAMVKAYEPDIFGVLDGMIPDSDGEPLMQFTARYILEPGNHHAQLETEITNISNSVRELPTPLLETVVNTLDIEGLDEFITDDFFDELTIPTGWALGFGAMNSQFMPEIGYDIQFGLEDIYETRPVDLPALPGHTTDLLATSGDHGISYGFATEWNEDSNFVFNKQSFYGDDVSPMDMLFLFEAAGYGGAFTHELPRCLDSAPTPRNNEGCEEDTFRATNYFILGSGDIASIRDRLYDIHDLDTATVTGRVVDEVTGDSAGKDGHLFVYTPHETMGCDIDDGGDGAQLLSQASTNSAGYFEFDLPPGDYCYRARYRGDTGELRDFELPEGGLRFDALTPTSGTLEAMIVDGDGRPTPAKLTLVGEYDPVPGLETREYLFDRSVGERWRVSASVDFDDETSPRQFIENIEFSGADGRLSVSAAPGDYIAYISRGNEYELVEKPVEIRPRGITRLNAQVERVLDTTGYLSGDYHMHAAGSIDSGLDYNQRVRSIAGEGVEVVVASDHNYISDYMPYIHRNQLNGFMRSIIGLELTTMEAGHFNAFPLRQDIASQNRGSVAWQNIPPQEIFDALRDMGGFGPENTIIQANHPRDSILGYFGQHNVDPLTGVADLPVNLVDDDNGDDDDDNGFGDAALAAALNPSGAAFVQDCPDDSDFDQCTTFSYDFDAIEIFNGKRLHLLRHHRMPAHDELSEAALDYFEEEEIDPLPPEGAILCDGDDVAHAGGLDDWYNFLNYHRPDGSYRVYTATANSDSHHYGDPDDPEPGFPRNYFWVGEDKTHETMEPIDLVQSLQDHHNIITNGPFINMSIADTPVGGTTSTDDGEVTLDLEVQATDWVAGDDGFEFTIVANGEFVHEGLVDLDDGRWQDSVTIDLDDHDIHFADDDVRDTWFVLEVEGQNNLFPVVQPAEIPMIDFTAALGSIAEPFGFGETVEGITPEEQRDITPFALTNPIFVLDNENAPGRSGLDDFVPPNPPERDCTPQGVEQPSLEIRDDVDYIPFGERRLDAMDISPGHHRHDPMDHLIKREEGELRDIRAIFDHWHQH